MKKKRESLVDIKQKISELKGKEVVLSINRGRKKFETFNAIIESVYPSVFTITAENQPKQSPLQTFSYFDVMCGDVVISEIAN
ncbi:MAG: Veg family protein [Christensenellales bacterium]|jgi:uncharacterized protein Veg